MMHLRLAIPTLLSCALAHAQWLNYREPGVPRLSDGTVNLSAPAPRTADGKPDLTGVWMHVPTPAAEFIEAFGKEVYESAKNDAPPGMNIELQNKYAIDIMIDFDADFRHALKPGTPSEKVPLPSFMRPEGFALLRGGLRAEINRCNGDLGWPLAGMLSEPIKIVQAVKETMVLYELGNLHREVYTDGRGFPAEFELPAYLGYSVGHWEGDTFVVETRGFNGKTWLDLLGHPRSDVMHITERFHRRQFGHLDYELTFDDPKYYTKPWTIRVPHDLVPDNDIFEMFCENERDAAHIK